MAKEILVIPNIPAPMVMDQWLVFGLDLSLSRTGWSALHVKKTSDQTEAKFLKIGSIKPESTKAPVWVRSKLIAKGLMDTLLTPAVRKILNTPNTGVLFVFEASTPKNDFLNGISQVVRSEFFTDHALVSYMENTPDKGDMHTCNSPECCSVDAKYIYTLLVNASTLRNMMHLTQRGVKNKKENIARAYDFLKKDEFPEVDSDACDAVLLAMVGRYVCSIFTGFPNEVPGVFLNKLCDSKQEIKGKGRNQHTITKGILYRPEYFYAHQNQKRTLLLKDASQPVKKLQKIWFEV